MKSEFLFLLSFFLVLGIFFSFPLIENNFTVDENGFKHYVLTPEKNNSTLDVISKSLSRYNRDLTDDFDQMNSFLSLFLLFLLLFLFYESRWFFALQTSNQIRFNTKILELFSRRNNSENQINNFEFEFSKIYSTLKLKHPTLSNNLLYFQSRIPHQTKKFLQFKKNIFIVSFLVFLIISPFPFGEIQPAYAAAPAVILLTGAGGASLLSETEVDITWGTDTRVDSGFSHTTSTKNIDVTATGVYRVTYGLDIQSSGAQKTSWIAHVEINDGDGQSCYSYSYIRNTAGDTDNTMVGECLLDLTAGDDIGLVIYKTTTANPTSPTFQNSGLNSWFQMQLIENDVIILQDAGGTTSLITNTVLPMDDPVRIDTNSFTCVSSCASGSVEVDTTGYYRVTYGAGFDISGTTRIQTLGNIQINGADSEYGWNVGYVRGANGGIEGAISASAILSLTAGDDITITGERNDGTTIVRTVNSNESHFDIEFLGTSSDVNLIRVHDNGGDQSFETTVDLDWDQEDDKGDVFTFTATSDSITVGETGLYHVSYSIHGDGVANDRYRAESYILVGDVRENHCVGSSYARQTSISETVASSSCYLELTADDVLKIELNDAMTNIVTPTTQANEASWSIQYMDFVSNTPPNTPTDITCDGGSCDVSVDASVDLAAVGSDPDGDDITFEFEAGLDTTSTPTDTTNVIFTVSGGTPNIESWTNNDSGASDSDSLTLTKPSGVETDDVLLIIVGDEEFSNTDQWDNSAFKPTGFTLINEMGTTVSDCHLAAFYRVADGTEGATVAVPKVSADNYWGSYLRITGIDTSTPLDVIGSEIVANANNISITGVTTTNDDALAFYLQCFDGGDGEPFSVSGTGWVEQQEHEAGAGSGDAGGSWGIRQMTTAGATGTATVTASLTDGMGGFQFALNSVGATVEASTDATEYTDFDGDHDTITSIKIEVDISAYDNSGSTAAGNNAADIKLEVYDGTSYDDLGNFSISGTGLFSITESTDGNGILTGWKISANQDFRITGVNMDNDGGSNVDSIIVDNVNVTIIGDKWTSACSYIDTTTDCTWTTSGLDEQTNVNLRVRGIDASGSNTYSAYYDHNENLDISHGPTYEFSVTDTPVISDTATMSQSLSESDTPTITDSATVVESHSISGTDTPTVTDSATVVESHTISGTDTPTITDSATVVESHLISSTDTPTVTDSATTIKTSSISVTDTPTITDSATESSSLTNTDTPTVTDSATIIESHSISATDTPTITDSATESSSLTNTDTPTVTDSATVIEIHNISATDTPTITDSATESSSLTNTDTPTVTDSATVIEIHNISVTDTPTVTDSAITVSTFSVTDTPTVTDSATTIKTSSISVTDTPTITDSATIIESHSISVTDTPVVSDSATVIEIHNISVTDTPTITDSTTIVESHVVVSSDTPTISDSTVVVRSLMVSDTPTITDSATVIEIHAVSVTDTPVISDSATTIKTSSISATDTPTITDSATVIESHNISGTDTPTISDSTVVVRSLMVSDTPTITDSATVIEIHAVSVTDTPVISDSVVLIRTLSVSDTPTITDSATVIESHSISVSDTPVVSDSAIVVRSLMVSDTPTITDSATVVESHNISGTDTPSISDSATTIKTSSISVTDTPILSDSATTVRTFSVSDTPTITDSATVVKQGSLSVTDTPTISDFATVVKQGSLSVSDTPILSDSTTVVKEGEITETDTPVLSDSVTILESHKISVTDTPTITDSGGIVGMSIISVTDTPTITDSGGIVGMSIISVTDTPIIYDSSNRGGTVQIADGTFVTVPTSADVTSLFQYPETEGSTSIIVILDVALPSGIPGTIIVDMLVENNIESGLNLATAVDITAPCTDTCTIKFTILNTLLTAAGLTPVSASIIHDTNGNKILESSEAIVTTIDTTSIPGSTIFTATTDSTSHFGVGSGSGTEEEDENNGGGGCEDCTPPTLGVDSSGMRMVSNGFSYNGNSIDVELYFTPYPLITTLIGANNTAVFKIYENSGPQNIRHFELAFGLDEIQGISQIPSRIEWDRTWDNIESITVIDPENVFENIVIETDVADCLPDSNESTCLIITIFHSFRAPLEHNIVATNVWDHKRNAWQNYYNEGVLIEGDSLNPPKQHVGIHKGHIFNITETSKTTAIDESGNNWILEKGLWGKEYIPNIAPDPKAIELFKLKEKEIVKAAELILQMCPKCNDIPFDKINNTFAYNFTSIIKYGDKLNEPEIQRKLQIEADRAYELFFKNTPLEKINNTLDKINNTFAYKLPYQYEHKLDDPEIQRKLQIEADRAYELFFKNYQWFEERDD